MERLCDSCHKEAGKCPALAGLSNKQDDTFDGLSREEICELIKMEKTCETVASLSSN